MGRWPYSDRWTVEECKSLSTKLLNQHLYLEGEVVRCGECIWKRNGKQTGSIGFEVSTVECDEYIRFQYTYTNRNTDEKIDLDYKARLIWTPCYFGGRRWWFICPLILNGQTCNRRVGILYLASGKYFGCRHCYYLTYESCRENHKFDNLFRKLGIL